MEELSATGAVREENHTHTQLEGNSVPGKVQMEKQQQIPEAEL